MPARSRLPIALAVAILLAVPPTAGAAPACPDGIAYNESVPAPGQEIPGFPYRRALTSELNAYVNTVDEASDRVRSGVFATSWNGTPLPYALVSTPQNLQRLDAIVGDLQSLRDPRRTSPARARALAARTPAIVWYTANVHGHETSGADAAVHLLHDLADRRDCEVLDLIEKLVIGIIPTQNPDGRDAVARQNVYGFDMNRDWFARTQPETDGKLDLLRRYPPVLFIDAHEMGSSDFFFPPNADPIHHEISPESLHWINDLYGKALAEAFDERRQTQPTEWDHFSYSVYDLFYMGYGDTVPTTVFTSAGMTFEKGTADPDHQREAEQYVAGYTSLLQAARHKTDILRGWYRAHATALEEGRRGFLEPNMINEPGNTVERPVPRMRVRHYFIGNRRADADAARLVDRLLRTGVEVYRLDRALRVPHLRGYGRAPRTGTVPAGSFWIPMAQPQKRWIQALLGEDPYTPFAYFYDVTAWSNPLLMNLDAWFTGDVLSPSASRVRAAPTGGGAAPGPAWFPGDTARAVAAAWAMDRAGAPLVRVPHAGADLPEGSFVLLRSPSAAVRRIAKELGVRVRALRGDTILTEPEFHQPRVAVYQPLTASVRAGGAGVIAAGESLGHLRYLLGEAWDLPHAAVTTPDILLGALGGVDVLIVPGVDTTDLLPAAPMIRSWIEAGGTYVGTARPGAAGGTPFAVQAGFTTASFGDPGALQVPGTMFRVELDPSSPLTTGAPKAAYWYHLGEDPLLPSQSGTNVVRYPRRPPEFWFSGYAEGAEVLRGTVGLVEEALGDGRVILFSGEPNYRAYTDAQSFILANALASARSAHPPGGADVGSARFAEAVAGARASVGPMIGPGRPIRLAVPASAGEAAARVLRELGARGVIVRRIADTAFLTVPNPRGLDVEEHPFAYRMLAELRAAGIEVRSAIL